MQCAERLPNKRPVRLSAGLTKLKATKLLYRSEWAWRRTGDRIAVGAWLNLAENHGPFERRSKQNCQKSSMTIRWSGGFGMVASGWVNGVDFLYNSWNNDVVVYDRIRLAYWIRKRVERTRNVNWMQNIRFCQCARANHAPLASAIIWSERDGSVLCYNIAAIAACGLRSLILNEKRVKR